jgi:hypothetical protein
MMTLQQRRRNKLAIDRKKLKFREALRARYPSAESLMKALGMDQNTIGELVHNEKSRSIMDDKRAHEMMAQHGHASHDQDFDAMDWRSRVGKAG